MKPKTTIISFTIPYADDSGVEFGVTLDSSEIGNEIELESVNKVTFPIEKIDWLIGCLQRIQHEVS